MSSNEKTLLIVKRDENNSQRKLRKVSILEVPVTTNPTDYENRKESVIWEKESELLRLKYRRKSRPRRWSEWTINNSTFEIEEDGRECRQYIVFPAIILQFFCIGIHAHLVQGWIQHTVAEQLKIPSDDNTTSGCGSTNASSTFKLAEETAAMWTMYNTLAATVPAFFGVLIVPSYSDANGRKFMFIIGYTSSLIKGIFYSMCLYYESDLKWIILVTGLDAVTGGTFTISSAVFTYVADVTAQGMGRAFGLTLVEACMLLSITASSVTAGFIVEFQSFLFMAVLNSFFGLFAWLLVVLFLQETHVKENRTDVFTLIKVFKRIIEIYTSSTFKKRTVAFVLLILAYFFATITTSYRTPIEGLYLHGHPFCWSEKATGLFSAIQHASQGVTGMLFVAPLKRCLSEISIAIWSTFFNVGSLVIEAFARTQIAIYTGTEDS